MLGQHRRRERAGITVARQARRDVADLGPDRLGRRAVTANCGCHVQPGRAWHTPAARVSSADNPRSSTALSISGSSPPSARSADTQPLPRHGQDQLIQHPHRSSTARRQPAHPPTPPSAIHVHVLGHAHSQAPSDPGTPHLHRPSDTPCPEPACEVGSFVEQDERIASPRAVLTTRACRWAIEQIRREHASVNGIRRQLGTGWRTVWESIRLARCRPLTPTRPGSSASRSSGSMSMCGTTCRPSPSRTGDVAPRS